MNRKKVIGLSVCVFGVSGLLTVTAMAQSSGSKAFGNNYHINFDRPEAWGLKYFASTTLLSGLQPVEPAEGHRVGAITLGFEMGWMPTLDAGQERIGFN